MPMSLLLIPPWLLIAAVLLGGIVQGEAYGRTWHVAKQALPQIAESAQFRTISEAAARVAPGDTVLIHGGVYREHVRVEASGTAGRPICFMAAPGERVVVTGADEIMDWEQADPERHIYRTPWPHEFIGWNETHAHPGDSYHVLIGRSEQVTVDGYLLHQVLIRDQLSRGSFYVDLEAKQLYVWGYSDQVLGRGARVEASTRDVIWEVKGDYVQVRGLRFRFAANHAQQGAAQFSGHHAVVEDCVF
jgi:hypothetical protein